MNTPGETGLRPELQSEGRAAHVGRCREWVLPVTSVTRCLLVVVNSFGKGREAAQRDVRTEETLARERARCIFRDPAQDRFKEP